MRGTIPLPNPCTPCSQEGSDSNKMSQHLLTLWCPHEYYGGSQKISALGHWIILPCEHKKQSQNADNLNPTFR
jgi:hypothetical protein